MPHVIGCGCLLGVFLLAILAAIIVMALFGA
jgi:hypothetical protein